TDQRTTNARPPLHQWQASGLDPAKTAQPGRRQDVGRDVLDHPREVPQLAFGVDEPRSFRARPTVAYEPHKSLRAPVAGAVWKPFPVSVLYCRSLKRLP